MRIALTVLLLMSPQAVQAQSPAPQLQARHDALIAREAGGHAMAAYERQWVDAFRAGDPAATAPWQWAYTERAWAEQEHRNGGSHFEAFYRTWTVTDDRTVAPPDWGEVGEACGRTWFGPRLMGRMTQWSSHAWSIEITIEGPGGARCEETVDVLHEVDGLWPFLTDEAAIPETRDPGRP